MQKGRYFVLDVGGGGRCPGGNAALAQPLLLPKDTRCLPASSFCQKRGKPPRAAAPWHPHLQAPSPHPAEDRGKAGVAAGRGGGRGQRVPWLPRGAPGRQGAGCCSLCLLVARSIPRQTPRLAACALSSPLISLSKWVCMDPAGRAAQRCSSRRGGGRARERGELGREQNRSIWTV